MPEREWFMPDADTLGRAMVLAEAMVKSLRQSVLVCAVIYENELGFNVMTAEGYADLRERLKPEGIINRLAPICSLLPSGAVEVYPSLNDWPFGQGAP